MNLEFEGKVALVTGGSSGIGQATAIAFAQAGARVAIGDVSSGEETVSKIRHMGGECLYLKADVSKSADVKALVQKTVEAYGRLDCAVNNAGISIEKDFLDWTETDWDKTVDINLKGVWLCMMNEIPQMLKQGRGAIVNISSILGLVAIPRTSGYIASKHGVLGLTKSASLEFAGRGIRTNSICPGAILTPMLENGFAKAPGSEQLVKAMTSLGRMAQPSELAAAALWLCSDRSSFVTGITMSVDGGWSQH